jgi:hypothetical protein
LPDYFPGRRSGSRAADHPAGSALAARVGPTAGARHRAAVPGGSSRIARTTVHLNLPAVIVLRALKQRCVGPVPRPRDAAFTVCMDAHSRSQAALDAITDVLGGALAGR